MDSSKEDSGRSVGYVMSPFDLSKILPVGGALLVLEDGEGNGTPLQYSCLENPMDGEAWWATVHGVEKSRTRLSGFAQHAL